jgi:hypothetical protein
MTERTSDEYIWDRSGEPDEVVRRLESLLARYRFARPLAPVVDEIEGERDERAEEQ